MNSRHHNASSVREVIDNPRGPFSPTAKKKKKSCHTRSALKNPTSPMSPSTTLIRFQLIPDEVEYTSPHHRLSLNRGGRWGSIGNFTTRRKLIVKSTRRVHCRQLIQIQRHTVHWQSSFLPATVKDWNDLPDGIATAYTPEHWFQECYKQCSLSFFFLLSLGLPDPS